LTTEITFLPNSRLHTRRPSKDVSRRTERHGAGCVIPRMLLQWSRCPTHKRWDYNEVAFAHTALSNVLVGSWDVPRCRLLYAAAVTGSACAQLSSRSHLPWSHRWAQLASPNLARGAQCTFHQGQPSRTRFKTARRLNEMGTLSLASAAVHRVPARTRSILRPGRRSKCRTFPVTNCRS